MTQPRVALVSLEPWDEVWRRNQHLVAELIRQHLVASVVFIEPPAVARHGEVRSPLDGVTVVRPPLVLPRRTGGLAIVASWLRRHWLDDVDVVWVNDPVLGELCAGGGARLVYDVTDDWRHANRPARLTRRLVSAEDRLARAAQRWKERYDVTAAVVPNAATRPSYPGNPLPGRAARVLPGPGPHVGYVGTLHEDRLDIDLLLRLADSPHVGSVHLVGPDAMSSPARARLAAPPSMHLHGAVPSADVTTWLIAMDALVLPHTVSEFTLSLDAIKAYEYLATDRPVVATPTSGFQHLAAPGLTVVPGEGFVDAVAAALAKAGRYSRTVPTWADRAREFTAAIRVDGPADTQPAL
jgi:teichuronic acid biosynthesis glycosyltransferase TuaH